MQPFEPSGVDPIEAARSLRSGGDEAGVTEHLEVLARRRLAHASEASEIPSGTFVGEDQAQELSTPGVSDGCFDGVSHVDTLATPHIRYGACPKRRKHRTC